MKQQNKSDWEWKKLGEIGECIRGVSYNPNNLSEEYSDFTVILFRANNIDNNKLNYESIKFVDRNSVKDGQLIINGDILICMSSGSKHLLGKSVQFNNDNLKKYTVGAFCSIYRTNKEVENKFVKFIFQSNHYKREISKASSGTNINNLKKGDIENILIPVPPIQTQKRIVSILERAEKLKNLRQEANEEIDSIIQNLFHFFFESKNFEESNLRNMTSLISSGSTPLGGSKNYLDKGEIVFIRSQNVLMNKFSQHDKLYISEEIHTKMDRTWVKKNDVLINITGASIGRTAIYNGEDNRANVNQHVCIIRLKENSSINQLYLNYFLSSKKMQNYILLRNAGATRQALNFNQIGNFRVPIPPISLQNQFASLVEKIESIKENQKESTEEINTLFDALMQKAFNGEIA